jgi:hypothetical protein
VIAFKTTVKQGASYLITCGYAVNGVDQLPLIASITSRVRTAAGTVLAECVVAQNAPTFTVAVAAEVTQTWPTGMHLQDIVYTYSDGTVAKTPTWYVEVEPLV